MTLVSSSHGEKYSLRVPVSRILCVLRELRFTDKILSERHTGLSFLFHLFFLCVIRVRTRYGSDGKRHTGIKKSNIRIPHSRTGTIVVTVRVLLKISVRILIQIRTDLDSDPYH